MAVLLTRPLADSQRIAADLRKHNIPTLIWPLTRIELMTASVDVPEGTEALVFSSSHAIRAFCDNSTCRDLPAFCVGSRTAEMARAQGFGVAHAAGGNFDALFDLVQRHAPRSVLYIRGREVTGDMEAALSAQGIQCASQIVYAADPADPPDANVDTALAQGSIRAVTIWSRRNADILVEAIRSQPDWRVGETVLIAISDKAAAPLGNSGFRRIIVASRPNATQMIAEIRAALR